ncbi:GAF domain-containing protein [Rhodococcus sp. NPDC019627]|uniref:GAF domain-containing protein n=1 Tax=unclassified Rhodococcus (in: high G+C Gram-positive bacteria) TaxID=192944 RepID=UPI0033D8F4CC
MKGSDVEGFARLLRPRDDDTLRAELRVIAAGFATPAVIFGGPVSVGTLQISETLGTRTAGLRGLLVSPRLGLGGRAMTQLRPQWVEDYASAQTITHDYDRPVINEGLRTIIAVPVVVGGQSRAILYAALRQSTPVGDRLFDMLSRAGDRLAAVGFVWAFVAAGREGSARAHYLARREHGDRHAAVLRHLFNRMLGQLYQCLQTDQKYDATKAFPCHGTTPEPAAA